MTNHAIRPNDFWKPLTRELFVGEACIEQVELSGLIEELELFIGINGAVLEEVLRFSKEACRYRQQIRSGLFSVENPPSHFCLSRPVCWS